MYNYSTSILVLPVFIFASLTNLLWKNGGNILLKLWKPILALIAIYLLLIIGYIFYVAIKYRVSAAVLIRKIMPSTIIGLTTASSMSSFEKINEVNRTLGLDESLANFSVAIGMALVFDFISTGSYIAMRHMEMVIQAGHLNLLDIEALRSKE